MAEMGPLASSKGSHKARLAGAGTHCPAGFTVTVLVDAAPTVMVFALAVRLARASAMPHTAKARIVFRSTGFFMVQASPAVG